MRSTRSAAVARAGAAAFGEGGAVPKGADDGLGADGFGGRCRRGRCRARVSSAAGRPAGSAGRRRHRGPRAEPERLPARRQPTRPPGAFESAGWLTRTALCVEVRDPQRANGPKAEREHGGKSGVLYVFMPPLRTWRTTSSCWPPSRPRPPSWA
jgi:hypothetical protein